MIQDLIENIMGTSQPLMPKTTHRSKIILSKPNKPTDSDIKKDPNKYKEVSRIPNSNIVSKKQEVEKKLNFSNSDENEPVLDDLVFQRSLKKPSFDAPRDETSLSFEDSIESLLLLSPILINQQGFRNNNKIEKFPGKTIVNKQIPSSNITTTTTTSTTSTTTTTIPHPEIFNIQKPPILWKIIDRILNEIKWILTIFIELFLFLWKKIW